MSEALVWHTEQRVVKDLVPMGNNPRRLTSKQKDDLAASLTKFNLMSIPVVNLDNGIISGHQRIKILILLGRGEEMIDVRIPNRLLSQEEVKEACIRENRNLGEWDWDVLAAEFPNADLLKWGFEELEFGKQSEPSFLGVEAAEDIHAEGEAGVGGPARPKAEKLSEGAEPAKKDESNIRLVQLFMPLTDHELFMASVAKLQSHLGVDNVTDAVFLTIQEAASKVKDKTTEEA